MERNRNDNESVIHFRALQSRQIIAIAVALFLVLLVAVLYKRPDLLGEFSKSELYGAQITIIASFIVYTALNWRCPSCRNYLGRNLHQVRCRKCGTRLQ